MKNNSLTVLVISFLFFLFCNVYAEQKNDLDKAVFHFDVSSAELTISEKDTIKRMAQKIACLNLKVLIESNTDITGNDRINIPLSEERADVVKDYFIYLGVSEEDIQIISYVSSNPVDTDRTLEAYCKNRRTEVTLIDPKKEKFPKILK